MNTTPRPDILFVRVHLPPEEEYGFFAEAGSTEVSPGLCWLAATVRKEGYKTEIIDAHVLKFSNEELARVVLRKNPKYIGISSDILNIFSAADFARMIKSANPDIKIILGGPQITAVPEETMRRFPEFDIGVIGEGELTIVDLIKTLNDKKRVAEVKGIIYRQKNKKLKRTFPREFIKDLDSLPLPAWDLLPDLRKFYQPPSLGMHRGCSALLITSRGCPGQCIFCDRAVFGNRVRIHSAGYVMRMIRELYHKYKIRHIRFLDDNFLLFKNRLTEICNMMLKENLKITWSCFARVDSINPEILKLMKRSGCWQISYGIESGEQKILEFEKKRTTIEKIEKAVKMTREMGIKVVGFNIIGHPLETEESMQKTIDFNKKIKVDDFFTQYMTPYPGTELYNIADQYGKVNRDWRKMGVFKEPTFIPHGLTKEKIIEYHKRSFLQFYLQPRIILSYLRSIRSFKELIYFIGSGFSILIAIFLRKEKKQKREPHIN